MPRPKKEHSAARSQVFGVRLTPDERSSIEAKAATAGLTLTDYCRGVLTGSAPDMGAAWQRHAAAPALPPELFAAYVAQLGKIGSNLNQIARQLNSQQGFVPQDLADCLRDVKHLADQARGIF